MRKPLSNIPKPIPPPNREIKEGIQPELPNGFIGQELSLEEKFCIFTIGFTFILVIGLIIFSVIVACK